MGRLRDAREAVAHRLGRRGATLLTLGTVWVVIGISIVTAPPPDVTHLHDMLPIPLRVVLWVGPGLVAAASAAKPRGADDTVAFTALVLAPLVRSGSYAWSWVVHQLNVAFDLGWEGGDPRGWSYATVWVLVVALIRITAGWEESRSRRRRTWGGLS